MCGIFGTFGTSPNLHQIEEMGLILRHRGPDEFCYEFHNDFCLALNRLSIVDTDHGSQPFFSNDRSVIAIGNGEIYNYQEIKNDLIARGCLFRTGSDMEIIPHLYSCWGLDGFKKLRGMFGLAIWDKKINKGYLFRDFSGIKPLYYYVDESKRRLVFGSEIKILLALDIKLEPNNSELLKALSYRSSSLDSTCFVGVKKIIPGELLEFSLDSFTLRKFTVNPSLDDNFLDLSHGCLEELLFKSVGNCLMGDVPVGAFLSGGIDSGLNVMLMSKILGKSFNTFTVGYGISGDEFVEAKLISRLAKSCHHEILVDFNKINVDFHRIIWHMDEPFFDPAIIPSYFLSKEAALFNKVVLVGDGADEVFAGYQKHIDLISLFAAGKIDSKIFFESRMPFGFNDLKNIMNYTPEYLLDLGKNLDASLSLEDCLRKILDIDRKIMLPSLQLMKVDRATMAHGLEARVPFLDESLINFANHLSPDFLVNSSQGKLILRDVAKKYLPKSIYNGRKKIFFVPIDSWMDQGMNQAADKAIKSSNFLPELIKFDKADVIIPQLNSYQKLCLLSIDSWYKIFFEKMDINSSLI